MLMLCIVFICLHFFTFTENQKCSWEKGFECCTGYALNNLTGKCEKCPTGYFGDCSKRCTPPTFGEDCQSICNCPSEYCHFAHGCSQNNKDGSEIQRTRSTGQFSSQITSAPSTFPGIDIVSYPPYNENDKVVRSTLPNLSQDTAAFQNSYVFHIIIGLIGVFVLFFVVHVTTNVYSKFFGRTPNSHGMNENALQARYKSLNFETIEQEPTVLAVNLEQQRQMVGQSESLSPSSSYLSPVFLLDKNYTEPVFLRENAIGLEDGTIRESAPVRQSAYLQSENTELESSLADQTEHVYIEISENEYANTKI